MISLLTVAGLKKYFPARKGGKVHAVDGISFSIAEGETLGLVGESGCGKTTTIMQVLELARPTDGSVVVLGRDTARMTSAERFAVRRDLHQHPETAFEETRTAGIVAARLQALQPEERLIVRTPLDIYNLLGLEMAYLDTEHLRVVLVNTRNQLMAIREVYHGNVSSAVVRIAEVFQEAIRQNAPSIILVHNHPSGDPTPSRADIDMTKTIIETAKPLGITVHDHIIIGKEGHVSLKGQIGRAHV